jgi:hypothetical protein
VEKFGRGFELVVGVEANPEFDFGETLSAPVSRAVETWLSQTRSGSGNHL